MFELIKLTERTSYFDLPTKIGVYRLDDKKVILIDSGLNAKTGARVLKILETLGLEIEMIINTHSHTDHAGGDRYIKEATGCRVFASDVEKIYIEHPDLEAAFVFGGYPCRDFRKKFMNTEACKVEDIVNAKLPKGMEIIPLPGHTSGMIGIKTPDDVYFIADVVNGEHALEKAKICYVYDIDTQLDTLKNLKALDSKLCVPAHTDPTTNVAHLAQINIDNLLEIRERILSVLSTPHTTEELVAELLRQYGLNLDFMGMVMVTSAVRSHLTSLRHQGQIDWYIDNYFHYWKKAE